MHFDEIGEIRIFRATEKINIDNTDIVIMIKKTTTKKKTIKWSMVVVWSLAKETVFIFFFFS